MANEKNHNEGNFANDPERASEAGRKGGEHSHASHSGGGHSGASHSGGSHAGEAGKQSSQSGTKSGGQQSGGNFANDPERAAEAGRKGGEHSHSGGKR